MNLQEFKAWFEGFTENLGDRPTDKQWKRIKEKVKAIDGSVTSYPVFVDRYWPRPWREYWYGSYQGLQYSGNSTSMNAPQAFSAGLAGQNSQDFNSLLAFQTLGKAEAAEIEG